jgi:hypothetical protein
MKQPKDDDYKLKGEKPLSYSSRLIALLRALVETIACVRLGVSTDHIHGMSRGSARVVFARQLTLYLLHNVCRLTPSEAAIACERNRSTAVNALRHIEARREADASVDLAVSLIETEARRALKHVEARCRLGI